MAAGSEGPSDATLVAAMARGDQAALAVLYDRHAGLLLGAARRFLGSTAAAEDLVHDVLLEAWRRAASFDPAAAASAPGSSFASAAGPSIACDAVSGEGRPGRPDRDAGHGRGRRSRAGSEAARAREALASLPEGHRQVLELAYFGGLTMSEIADALGVPIGTVKSRSAGALSKLRRALDPTPATEGGE